VPGAETENGDGKAGPAERATFHGGRESSASRSGTARRSVPSAEPRCSRSLAKGPVA
jgi:hypothetical protein